ncbi:hypothetical protein [Marinicrinis sediminis]|uniref:Tellurium resistance protein TerC n=1 Tax=Marinicrinis sediminis TaxID=1652465 RepID=A0ABW5RFE2_9BACL
MNTQKWVTGAIIGFLIIGILASLRSLLIPILVLGTVFVLYKFPPRWWKMQAYKAKMSRTQRDRNRQKSKFKVVGGSKQDRDRSKSDSEPPRYH